MIEDVWVTKEPTAEQCSQHALVHENEHKLVYAIWYPQMGGYVGKALAFIDKGWKEFPHGATEGGCIDVLVWHDGSFPFDDGRNPADLHHCDPEQFIQFGEQLKKLNDIQRIEVE